MTTAAIYSAAFHALAKLSPSKSSALAARALWDKVSGDSYFVREMDADDALIALDLAARCICGKVIYEDGWSLAHYKVCPRRET